MTISSSRVVPQVADTPPHNGFSLISNEKLLEIYGTMLKCRMLGARIRSLTLEDKSIELRTAINHESMAAGIVLDLLPGDTLAPYPGGFIPSFVKGLPLRSIFSALAPQGRRHPPPLRAPQSRSAFSQPCSATRPRHRRRGRTQEKQEQENCRGLLWRCERFTGRFA